MKRKHLLSSLLAVAAIASGSAQAIVFTGNIGDIENAAWDSALNLGAGYTYDTFDDLAPVGGFAGPVSSFTSIGNGTFSVGAGITYASTSDLYLINSGYTEAPATFNLASGDALNVYGTAGLTVSPLTITAPVGSSYTAFGLDLGGVDGATTFTVAINGGAASLPQTLNANPTGSFFGVTSDAVISNVVITPVSGRLTLDNVGFAVATVTPTSPVPEPSSMALLGLGMAALGWRSRRKAKAV